MNTIDTPFMSVFKIGFIGDTIITCGDIGKVGYYDLFSREIIKKVDIGDSYLTALNVNRQ
jgi:hypothetical protein